MDDEDNELFIWSNTPVCNNESISLDKSESPEREYTTPAKKQRFSFGSGSTSALNSSPALAKRPPAVELGTQVLTQRPKIPENVLFSELPDEVFGTSPKKQTTTTVEREFYGVYCLISRSELRHYKNKCYIGYTVNPNRRIVQHNSGKDHGGAKKTDSRGPWDMVCIVHGFPNSITALRFEWAWQNPSKSRRLKDLDLKKDRKESHFQFRLRIVCHMLNSDPWKRFSLYFRWLSAQFEIPFPEGLAPPNHVQRKYGQVEKETETVSYELSDYETIKSCQICRKSITTVTELVRCPMKNCESHFHARCLAQEALNKSDEGESALLPVEVSCTSCFTTSRWGDLIRDQRALLQISQVAVEKYKITNAMNLVPKWKLGNSGK